MNDQIMNRRKFVTTVGLLIGTAASAGCGNPESKASSSTPTPKPLPEITPSESEYFPDVGVIEQRTYELVNQERGKHDYEPVAYEEDLAEIARTHSKDMAKRDFIGHDNPDGESHGDRLDKYGYYTYESGEIIASYTPPHPSEAPVDQITNWFVESWMDSPQHRRVMLDGDYIEAGVGVSVTSNDFFYATMLFSGRDTEIEG